MKISFYIKLFLAFIVFAVLLLGFSSFAFNNFYKYHNEKKDKKETIDILNQEEKFFNYYLESYDEKIALMQSNIAKAKNKEEIIEFVENSVFNDENIYTFKIIGLDSKEKFRIEKISDGIKVINEEKLKSIFTKKYFKDMRVLKPKEILHYNSNLENISQIDFILRNENNFYVFKINFAQVFNKIENDFLKKTSIINPSDSSINKNLNLRNNIISKKIYLNDNQYFEFIIKNEDFTNDYIKDYYKSIIIVGFCIALFLSLLFSGPIAKLNTEVEEKNKKLDLSIKKNFLELNENQKVIDKHIMFVRLTKDNIIIDASYAFCYFLGYSKGELIGYNYNILIHKDMKKKEQKRIWKQIKSGQSYVGEIKGSKKDSEAFWIDLFVEGIFENKKLVGYTVICTDITNKKKIEELYVDLNKQVEQYNAIFENVNSGISLIDSTGNFVKLNGNFSKFLGYNSKELLSMNCTDIITEDSRKILQKILQEVREIGNISNLEKIFVRKNGTFIHLELSLSILSSDKEHLVFVVNSLEDKRKLQELNQNLEQRINQEVEKNIQKDKLHQQEQIKNAKLTSIGSLAAGIAHEINTPLTYIKGNLELMYYDILDLPEDEIRNRMKYDSEKMKEGINRIANIVESMREMSQSSKEIKERTNIYGTLITSLTMAYNRSRQVCKIYLNEKLFDIDSINKNEFVFCSKVQKQRIEQVWIIVINNALDELIKVEDYEKRVLNILLFEEKEQIIIKFKDSAGGIKEEIINDIFEPFVSSKEHSGMGVGLNIAKKIIDEQEGIIKAYNEENGAVFEIRLKKCEEE
ncbi:PAS domain-containing sensor histidine kinase [Arcobacter defluvii]|uniref:histidine kinase n=1 Tax=Arcobacter defluvii TaxID=873191 RepID=A0AAE7E5S3_9BACT|nr:PAS domain-containing sensor histidine kinase [Arcobacter defluvii]QKF76627.1 PAS sensor-containing two-component system histidine kinase [Arcobacter defluvii]RXI34774.1 PAS domain-containing sensor histidine kinase [Arcobacter defluvii]